MRITTLNNRFICLLLVFSLTLQSCVIYKKEPISIEDAVIKNKKTLIINSDKTKHKYLRIIQIDGQYYGETKKGSKYKKVLLTENEIKSIHPMDKTASTIGNIVIVLVTLGGVILISTLNFAPDFNIDDSGY